MELEKRLREKLEAPTLDYEKYFSEKALGMKASEIRELLKLVESSDVISLAGGLPAPETFPVEIIEEIAKEVLEKHAAQALQYGTTKGFTPLRLAIAEWMRKRYDIPISKVDIMITSGSQQALDLIGRVFINPGDIIVVEAPTYLAALQAFKYYEPEFVQIPLDDEGMNIDLLEEKLQEMDKESVLKSKPFRMGMIFNTVVGVGIAAWCYKLAPDWMLFSMPPKKPPNKRVYECVSWRVSWRVSWGQPPTYTLN